MTSVMPGPSLGLGVDAGLAPHVARELAARCADLGYGSLWCNDVPGASGLETLAHFAAGAPQLDLGVGVLPLDEHPPGRIATEIERLALDVPKLGSGSDRGGCDHSSRPCATQWKSAWCAARGAPMIGTMSRSCPARRSARGRCAAQLDVAVTCRGGARLDPRGSHLRRTPRSRDRPLHPRRSGRRRHAAARDEESRYRRMAPAHFEAMKAPLGAVGVCGSSRHQVVEALRRTAGQSICRSCECGRRRPRLAARCRDGGGAVTGDVACPR